MNTTNPKNPINPTNPLNRGPHIGAFFDFDKTLIKVESGRVGFKYLYQIKEISLAFLLKVALVNYFYQRDWVSDTQMARVMLTFYKGRNIEPLKAGAKEFYLSHLKPHLATNILDRARRHQAAGHTLVLVSASVRYMLEPVTKDLGFDHLLCTDLEMLNDGQLTGSTEGPICIDKHKRDAIRKLAHRHHIQLNQSHAYGNHQSDIPMLETVGHPSVVEPTPRLRKKALSEGWPILSF